MDLTHIIGYSVTAIALVAVVLNIKKNYLCFVGWLVSNTTFATMNALEHKWYEVILFSVQFCIAVWGLYEWRLKEVINKWMMKQTPQLLLPVPIPKPEPKPEPKDEGYW